MNYIEWNSLLGETSVWSGKPAKW